MTDRPAKRSAPRIDLTGLEWRLVVATWIALVYLAAWFAIHPGKQADPAPLTEPAGAPAAIEPRPRIAAAPPRTAPPKARSRPRTDVISGASSRR